MAVDPFKIAELPDIVALRVLSNLDHKSFLQLALTSPRHAELCHALHKKLNSIQVEIVVRKNNIAIVMVRAHAPASKYNEECFPYASDCLKILLSSTDDAPIIQPEDQLIVSVFATITFLSYVFDVKTIDFHRAGQAGILPAEFSEIFRKYGLTGGKLAFDPESHAICCNEVPVDSMQRRNKMVFFSNPHHKREFFKIREADQQFYCQNPNAVFREEYLRDICQAWYDGAEIKELELVIVSYSEEKLRKFLEKDLRGIRISKSVVEMHYRMDPAERKPGYISYGVIPSTDTTVRAIPEPIMGENMESQVLMTFTFSYIMPIFNLEKRARRAAYMAERNLLDQTEEERERNFLRCFDDPEEDEREHNHCTFSIASYAAAHPLMPIESNP